jgi:hypothetical protein
MIFFIFNTCKDMNIEPLFCKQVIHLQSQNTFYGLCSLKISHDYMTRFSVVILKNVQS